MIGDVLDISGLVKPRLRSATKRNDNFNITIGCIEVVVVCWATVRMFSRTEHVVEHKLCFAIGGRFYV